MTTRIKLTPVQKARLWRAAEAEGVQLDDTRHSGRPGDRPAFSARARLLRAACAYLRGDFARLDSARQLPGGASIGDVLRRWLQTAQAECPACGARLPNDGSCCDACEWVAS